MSKQPHYPPYASQHPTQYGQASGPQPPSASTGYNFQPVKITKDLICIASTNEILYEITRPTTKFHFSSSEKPAIQIGNSQTGPILGTIRTHKMSQDVDCTIHNRATAIKEDPWGESNWCYTSVFISSGKLWWSEDTRYASADKGALRLMDAKRDGRVIAQLKNDILTFQMSGLSQAMMDEVMVSAVAVGEAMKRKRTQEKLITEVILEATLGASGP